MRENRVPVLEVQLSQFNWRRSALREDRHENARSAMWR
jgi:hypothetical protein